MRKRVLVKGPALSRSGYGEQTRFAIRALRSREDIFEVFVLNLPWGRTGQISMNSEDYAWIAQRTLATDAYIKQGGQFDIAIPVTVPNEFARLAPITIGYTAGIETTKVAPQWIQKTNQTVDKVVVVSDHSKKVFQNTSYAMRQQDGSPAGDLSLNVPIETVNYPVRTTEPAEVELEFTTENNFLVVSQWGPRKNMENTVRWFVEKFLDDDTVGLVLKTNTASDSIIDREHTQHRLEATLKPYADRKCKVYLIHGELTPGQLTWLYQHPTMKALINIGHGEGYGLPLFEAAYNGLPLLTVAWSGQMDFICKPNKKGKSYPRVNRVDYNLQNVQKSAVWNGVIQADSMWAFAKESSYKKALGEALEKETHYRKEAKALQEHIVEKFSEENIYAEFCNAILEDSLQENFYGGALNEISISTLM